MKTKIIATEDNTQIVFIPETKFDINIIESLKLYNAKIEAQISNESELIIYLYNEV